MEYLPFQTSSAGSKHNQLRQAQRDEELRKTGEVSFDSSSISGRGQTGGKRCARDGRQFPVCRIHRLLCKSQHAEQVGAGAQMLEHLTAKILKLASNASRDNKTTRIIPSHLQFAIPSNEELNKLLGGATIAQGGVLPIFQAVLLPKTTEHPSKVYALKVERNKIHKYPHPQ
ncbi:histone H2A-like [Scyliorhinus torazame]|uniref:histone H2A-like n=1 Tax=Scyliorhinus torazame TaxID=75743 RepID=UPI003B5C6666